MTAALRHTGRSKLITDSAIAAELVEYRKSLREQDARFCWALSGALKSGKESLKGCLGKFRVAPQPTIVPPITPLWLNSLREGLVAHFPPQPTPPTMREMLERIR